jgi:hypothetical protein
MSRYMPILHVESSYDMVVHRSVPHQSYTVSYPDTGSLRIVYMQTLLDAYMATYAGAVSIGDRRGLGTAEFKTCSTDWEARAGRADVKNGSHLVEVIVRYEGLDEECCGARWSKASTVNVVIYMFAYKPTQSFKALFPSNVQAMPAIDYTTLHVRPVN